MKKFVTTLLLSLLSVLCVFAVTACGGNEKEKEPETEKEVKTTVTEEEWKTALTYFKVDTEDTIPVKSDYPRTNLSCYWTYADSESSDAYTIDLDFDKKALAFDCRVVDEEYVEGFYAWKGSDNCYGTLIGNDSYNKEEMNEEELLYSLDNYLFSYAGGEFISMLELVDKFTEFTYQTETAKYTASFYSKFHEGTCDISLKFENGKLKQMSVTVKADYVSYYTCEYTYGIAVTVPEYLLNLELGETAKPQKNNK